VVMPLISGLSMPPKPVTPPPGHAFDRGRRSCQLRRPGAPLRGHQEGNGGTTPSPGPDGKAAGAPAPASAQGLRARVAGGRLKRRCWAPGTTGAGPTVARRACRRAQHRSWPSLAGRPARAPPAQSVAAAGYVPPAARRESSPRRVREGIYA
jgi:hypothetical protein